MKRSDAAIQFCHPERKRRISISVMGLRSFAYTQDDTVAPWISLPLSPPPHPVPILLMLLGTRGRPDPTWTAWQRLWLCSTPVVGNPEGCR